jgi:hypothetical protein
MSAQIGKSTAGVLLWMVLSGIAAAITTTPTDALFQSQGGGYESSNAFSEDPDRHGVIVPPAALRTGDWLLIEPLRINSDEYLILQACVDPDCSKAQVVRAWNAYGRMGPYPTLTKKVRVETGVRYMLWLQRVPTRGNGSFKLIERDAPPLVFVPDGAPELMHMADLDAARDHGPSQIKRAQVEGASFVVTFDRGSVVRMRALRPDHPGTATNP